MTEPRSSSHSERTLAKVDAMDGGCVYVSHYQGLTALSVAWEGGVTSVEMASGQVALLIAELQKAFS